MAYVPLTTVASGGTILTTWGNQVKDNFAAGVPDIFTTKGDIAVASANDTAARLAAGADYTVPHARAGATLGIEYTRGVWCYSSLSAPQSITNNTATKITIANSGGDADLYSMFDGVNYRMTIPSAFPSSKIYCIDAWGYFDGHATDSTYRLIQIRVNGSSVAMSSTPQVDDVSFAVALHVSISPIILDANHYVELWVQQNSGGNLNFNTGRIGLFMIR